MQLEQARPLFEQRGARIVAISADSPSVAAQTKSELGLGFTVLPDSDLELMRLYNHRERYSQLQVHNPAVYIVDREGVVRYVHFGQDAGDRPAPTQIWQALTQVQSASQG